jgi:hypothetical protein
MSSVELTLLDDELVLVDDALVLLRALTAVMVMVGLLYTRMFTPPGVT